MSDENSILYRLMQTIQNRKSNPSDRSYTAKLFAGGLDAIGEKILEEANELVHAGGEGGPAGRTHLVHEAADLVYHMFVLLGYRNVGLQDVEAELARRFGTSGLDEKASRTRESPEE